MSATPPGSNEMLWLLKASWLKGEGPARQREVSLIVADWLEEQGEPLQAQVLRGSSWVMWYDAMGGCYFVAAPGVVPKVTLCWPVHFFPSNDPGQHPRRLYRCDESMMTGEPMPETGGDEA